MKTQTSKTAAVMGLLSRGPASAPAPAGGAPSPAERTIDEITADILRAKQSGGEAVLAIGRGLIEAKTILNHGEWLPWLSERVEFSERTAQNFMRLAREWSNPQALADLGAAKALTLLALPETERAAFAAETHLVDGEEKTVIDMTSRELEKAVRERAEALEAKERAEAALARAVEEADRAAADSIAARKELDELKSRPVEVAVQVDQEAVEKAREEGYQQAKKELKTAEKAAGEQVSRANETAAQVKTELDQARKEIEDLKFEARRAGNPSSLSTDADLAQFKLLFDQAQTIVNQMQGLLLKVRKRNDEESAGKLEAALTALSDKVRGCAQ